MDRVALFAFLFAMSCGDSTGGGTTGTGTGTTGTSDGTTGTSGGTTGTSGGTTGTSGGTTNTTGGPTFLSFGASAAELTQGETVTFSAVLTDPDGIDDLAGGTLVSPDGSVHYGGFTSGAQKGAYTLTLSWAQIDQGLRIEFTGQEVRSFVAQFFDAQGHQATRTATVRLVCSGGGACDGACMDLMSDRRNCGSCGRTCTTCGGGLCVQEITTMTPSSCDAVCGARSLTCTPSCKNRSGDLHAMEIYYGDNVEIFIDDCAVPPPSRTNGAPVLFMKCCCGD